jgi:hypothetical protein
MNFQSRYTDRKRLVRRGAFQLEALEQRTLLAAPAESFNLPSLTHLIIQAREGVDTAPAAINLVVTSLASQLLSGPLADFNSGAVNGDGFVAEVQSMVSAYDSAIKRALVPEFPNVYTLLVLQGQRITADESALNQQNTVGLLSDSDFATQAENAINALTNGPLFSLHTQLTGYANATQSFEASLHNIADGLGASAPLAPSDASLTMLADTIAYQAGIHAALQVTHPGISNTVDSAIASLINTANAVAGESASDGQMLITTAISAFDAAILDATGVFGPKGVIANSIATRRGFPPHTKDHRASSFFTTVSGTASNGGTATLTATLFSSKGQAIPGVNVSFTLDGAFAGVAATNTSGVATLTGVTTSNAVGTDTGGIVAFFAGNSAEKSSTGTGDLTVSAANTTLTSVSGTATFGGTATLTATLTSSVTGNPIANEPVTFTLDGTPVGSAVMTNSSGVATLTGVATTDSAGTHAGAVVANFAGTSDLNKSTGTGALTVSKANTTLSSVSGSAAFGGTATLTATLKSSVTSSGISGQTISFTLDGTSVGTAMTNSSGVATLMNVPTSKPVGTDTGAVVATYTATTNFSGSSGTGDLVVSKSDVTFSSVAGTATGGMATLMATLTSAASGMPLSGFTVNFSLDGTAVGPATTDSNGLAKLTGVPTSDPTGTHPNAVSVAYAGSTDYNSGTAKGTLVVS